MNYKFLIDAISEELKKKPSAQLLKERGRLRMMNGDKEGAIDDIQKAIEMDCSLLKDLKGEFKL